MLGIAYLVLIKMDIKKILNKSFKMFMIGEIVFLLISIYLNNYTFLPGFLLGYLVSITTFLMTVKMTDAILALQHNSPLIVALIFVLKLTLIGLSFYVSIVFDQFFHLAATFVGCLIMRVTLQIYYRKEVS